MKHIARHYHLKFIGREDSLGLDSDDVRPPIMFSEYEFSTKSAARSTRDYMRNVYSQRYKVVMHKK